MEMQNFAPGAPGKGMLKVCGILYMVFGGLTLLPAFALFAEDAANGMGILLLISVMYPAQAGFSIFVGIYAKINAGNLQKAALVRLMLIIQMTLLVLPTAAGIFALFAINAPDVLATLAVLGPLAFWGLAVPIVALVGAQKNVRAHKQEITPKG